MPRMFTEEFSSGDQTWLGSDHGITNARTNILTTTAFVKATHYPDGYLRSGTPVNAANESDVKPWTNAAGEKLGFVLFDRKIVNPDGTVPTKINVPVLRHGTIKLAKLPVALTEPTTGSGAGFIFVSGGVA